jgi:HEAT repeat protein
MYHRSKGLSFAAALRDIEGSKPRDRVAAAEVLSSAENDEERSQALDALAKASGDPRPEVRSTSVVALAELQRPEAWEIIALCLSDTVPEVRQCAAIALGTLGAPEAFPALLEALEDGAPDLRFQAASSLVEVDAEAAYEPLVAALEDQDSEVLGAVALALGAIGNAACADLIANLLDHSARLTRLDAAYALAEFGDIRAQETLAAALSDAEVGWDAVAALQTLGKGSAPALAEFLVGTTGAPRVRVRAAGAYLGLEPDAGEPASVKAKALLCDTLRSRKIELRGLAIQELEAAGGKWALTPLANLQRSLRGRKLQSEIETALATIQSRIQED